VDQLKVRQVNDIDLMALLKNVLIAFLGLPKQMPQQQIVVLITALKSHILINVFANGFRMDDGMEEKFRRTNPSCSEAVHSSNLVHFYVARKIVSKLRGSLEASLSEKNQHLFIRIPLIEKKSAGTRS
jgi:sensor histidine kinase regulating citrate/malate metabolism